MSITPLSGRTAAVLPVGFAAGLARFGERAALISGDRTVTYQELGERVACAASTIGPARRLVRVELGPDLASVAAYLACLAAGHPVLLAAPDALPDPRYPAEVSVRGGAIEVHRSEPAHALHPELALLMSTSGSTGSPKLVRLSRDNLQANAQAIAQVLAIRPGDRAVTTLPLHYCFGLSVLHSHLLVGAATVLTGLSVTEPCFWDLAAATGVTTLAGVPHTFALLERSGFADRDLPTLRSVLQAGGRLAPDKVRHWAQVGQRQGWDLHVMYGQTEATARMAVLPPDLAHTHPECIGRAIPGGALSLEPCPEADEPGVGELVYTGPNVMLGYAEHPEDLALGRTLHQLRTGDLARIDDDGLVQIAGRRSRFLKVFGQRLDLEHLERQLGTGTLALHGDDEVLRVAAEAPVDLATLQRRVAALTGLPPRCIQVTVLDALPRTAAGKVDGQALSLLSTAPDPLVATSVLDVVAGVLSLPLDQVTWDSTFAGLGGDSLSYVEAAIHLQVLLPDLPADWHLRRLDTLTSEPTARPPGWGRWTDTSVLLRALATLLIVAHHSEVVKLLGGAHLLLGVAGYNFARFQLTPAVRRQRVRRIGRSLGRVVVPSVAAIGLSTLLLGRYDLSHLLLVHDLVSPGGFRHFWFVEVFVQLLAVATALLAVPVLDRAERRAPLAFPVALLGLGLALRFDLFPTPPADRLYAPYALAWLFLWGWAAQRSRHRWHRAGLTTALAGGLIGFFPDQPGRALLVGACLTLLLWAPRLTVPALLQRLATVLAASSLHTYVLTFLVLVLTPGPPLLGFAACLLAGHAFRVAEQWLRRTGPAFRRLCANSPAGSRGLPQT